MLWDRAAADPRHDALIAEGWRLRAEKAFLEADLTSLDLPDAPPPGWGLRTLAELGEERFAVLLIRAAEGDPFEQTPAERALDDLRELIAGAGAAYDPSSWYAVTDSLGDLGVVLPQVFADRPEEGTLFYIGIHPERRGQGFGRQLHRWGLAELVARGATRYVGSTDLRNAPMLAVFASNGVKRTRTQAHYVK